MRLLNSVIAATIVVTSTASAHHSPAAFNMDSQITVQGTVRRFDWANPHVYIYIHAPTGAGDTREWTIETDGTETTQNSKVKIQK